MFARALPVGVARWEKMLWFKVGTSRRRKISLPDQVDSCNLLSGTDSSSPQAYSCRRLQSRDLISSCCCFAIDATDSRVAVTRWSPTNGKKSLNSVVFTLPYSLDNANFTICDGDHASTQKYAKVLKLLSLGVTSPARYPPHRSIYFTLMTQFA